MRFEDSFYVEEVFVTFRSPSFGIQRSPDLALQDVFDRGNWKVEPQDLTSFGARNEFSVAWIGLNLHAQVGAGREDVEAVWKLLGLKPSRR